MLISYEPPDPYISSCLGPNQRLLGRSLASKHPINMPKTRRGFSTTAKPINSLHPQYEERIRYDMHRFSQTKWGYVIYRCTYGDDKLWEELMQFLKDNARRHLEETNDMDLWDSLEWKVVSDSQKLDGANTKQVAELHRLWVESDEARAEQPTAQFYIPLTSRQIFCVHVDADALSSFANRKQNFINGRAISWDYGYANLVYADWGTYPLDPGEEDEDDALKTNYMHVQLDHLLPSTYGYIHTTENWHFIYVQPPLIYPFDLAIFQKS